MKIILGGKHLPTPIGSSVSIQGSMSDAVPKCNVAIYDEDSSIEIECPQEMIVIDEKEIENPTWNMLRNPGMDPYTSEWWQRTATGITLSTVTGGGIQATFNNAAKNDWVQESQYTYQGCVAGGQTYKASCYVIGTAPVNFYFRLHVFVVDATNVIALSEGYNYAVPTTNTRFSFTFTVPVSADKGNVFFNIEFIASSNTNSGSAIATQAQLEPEWFDTQTYPTDWCGTSQTDCRQLPNLTWIRQYRKFGGFVVSPSYDDYHGNVRTVHIQAVGYAWLLGTIYPDETYSSQYDSYILGDLADTYLVSADPRGGTPSYTMVNTDNVVQGVQITSFVIPRDDMKTVCNNLASQIGFYWTIDAYWNLIYAPPGYYVSSYSLICDNSSTPDMETTFPAYNFSRNDDLTQPGSNILVVGSGSNVAQVIDPVRVRELGYISGYFLPTNSSWMRKVQATELGNIADCNQRGIAELLQYSKTRSLYKLTTDACELVAGQAIAVTSSTDGLNRTSLLLQSVTARWIGTDEILHDKWEYDADLGGMNRQVQNILNRLFKKATSSSTSPTITQTSLVIFEQIGMLDTPSVGTAATGYQAVILADSPLAYYRLGELLGTTADDFSGHAYHGSLHGGITLGATGLLAGDSDTAMTFNGSSGYISLPTTFEPTGANPWSIEAWVKVSAVPSSGTYYAIIAFGTNATRQSAQLKINGTGGGNAIFVCSTYAGDISGGSVTIGTTYHVVGTYNGTSTRLYVNGSLIAGPTAYALNIAMAYASIGADGATVAEYFNGSIDEPAIYNYALSASQILAHYNAGI